MTPSVRGRERRRTAAALLVGSVAGGVVLGFVLGVAAVVVRAPMLGAAVAAGLVAAAVVLDVVAALTGFPRPLAVRTQVPRDWARLLPLPTAAALYGLRLGAGPLTILATWAWWAGALAAATHGVWISAAAGAWFALVRTLSTLALSRIIESDAPRVMATVRRHEPIVFALTSLMALAAAAATAVAA